ncbi:MAG: amino acid adenylation domain-containing protein, partial [Polyangiaceae bacterium]
MTARALDDLLERSASLHPDRVAVWCPVRGPVRYRELDALANRIAHFLVSVGVKKGDRVAILLPKSADTIAATQGVLRAGAAYVPLDPLGPAARALAIVTDCKPAALIADANHLSALMAQKPRSVPPCLRQGGDGPGAAWSVLDELPTTKPQVAREPSSLAYVLFTSGSTGLPKGVCITDEAALAFVDWAASELSPTPADVFSNHAPLHFDLSVLDLYVAFGAGASIVVVPEAAAFVPARLVDLVVEHKVTVWYSVPSALVLMMDAGGFLARDNVRLRHILFAGEPFPPAALARLRRGFPQARLFNLYGPTETNVCTFYEVPAGPMEETARPIPIGTPCCGDEAWAEKEDGSRAVAGEAGELLVRGPTVMRGYFAQPPHPRGAPYRTGDWVRVRPDGSFDYVGRRDGMVKVHGYRVELGEIEATLARHCPIREVAATIVGAGVQARIVAALVPSGAYRPTLIALKTVCSRYLPRYM